MEHFWKKVNKIDPLILKNNGGLLGDIKGTKPQNFFGKKVFVHDPG